MPGETQVKQRPVLGCGLVVGQRFLVAQIVGSNPTIPANTHNCAVRRESQLAR